jgi:hypothetical protein
MRIKSVVFIVVVFLLSHQVFGQHFIARVSSKVIGKKDIIQVEYVGQDVSITDFVPPPFINWNVAGAPEVTSSQVQTNNEVHTETIYTFTLQPRTIGKLIIPAASAKINGTRKLSNSVVVLVNKQDHLVRRAPAQQNPLGSLFDQQPTRKPEFGSDQFLRKGEDPRSKIKNNLLVKLDVNKRSFVVGEPILVTYKLCTRLRSQSKVVSQPAFTGCTVIEMTTENPAPKRETVNGRSYNVYVVRQVQLIPLQEGPLLLPEASVENKVAFYDASQVDYRDLYYNNQALPVQEQTVTLKSEPIVVDIKPLPPLPAVGPADFSGGVGQFNIAVAPSKSVVETNNTNQLIVEIEGAGNLQQVKAPVIQWPAGIEGFQSTLKNQEDKSYFPMRVRKTFTFPFIVSKTGTYTIPPNLFTYYDPANAKYVTQRTAPIPLQVVKGYVNSTFLSSPNANDGFKTRLIIIIGAVVIAVIIGLIWFTGRNKPKTAVVKQPIQEEPVTIQEATEDSSKYLFNIRELWPEENSAAFYKKLCSNIHGFIQEKYHIQHSELKEYIRKQNGDVADLLVLQSLLDNCALGMYTPVYSIDEAIQHRLVAIETLSRLDKA